MFTIKAVTAAGVVDTFECERFTPRSFAEDKHEVIFYNGTRNGSHKFGALIVDIAKGDRDHAGPLRYVSAEVTDAHDKAVYSVDLNKAVLVENVPEQPEPEVEEEAPPAVPEPITFKEEAGKLIVDKWPTLALISQEAIDAEDSPFDLDEEGILSIEVDNDSAKYEPTETKDVYSLMEEDDA